jgi:NADH dehydrogenase FAD-containing subunit
MGKHLVLVGGGHAHMTTMAKLGNYIKKGHRVTLIGPSPYHYYSGMGPGMLSGMYKPSEIRFHVKKMAEDRGAVFVEDSVVLVDNRRRILHLSSGDEIPYHVVSFNIGSKIPINALASAKGNLFPVKPIENLIRARQLTMEILDRGRPRLCVLGGGPAGLEMAGNIWRVVHVGGGTGEVTLLAGRKFLSRCPEKVRRLAKASLISRDIEIVEGAYVNRLENNRAVLEDGREYPFDLAVGALGVKPPELFRQSGFMTGQDGGLLVNAYLQSVDHPEVFGGGDCISFQHQELDKVGVYAVRENPILYHNIMAALEGGKMKRFEPADAYLLIFNLGDGSGIFWKKRWVWAGRLAFILKDYIDRKFVKKFQISGERQEGQDSSYGASPRSSP